MIQWPRFVSPYGHNEPNTTIFLFEIKFQHEFQDGHCFLCAYVARQTFALKCEVFRYVTSFRHYVCQHRLRPHHNEKCMVKVRDSKPLMSFFINFIILICLVSVSNAFQFPYLQHFDQITQRLHRNTSSPQERLNDGTEWRITSLCMALQVSLYNCSWSANTGVGNKLSSRQ